MFKYVVWVIRLIIPILRHYPWIFAMSRHPQRYSLKLRYNKVRHLVFVFLRIVKVDPYTINMPVLQPGERVYLVGNHVSFFDPVVLVAVHRYPITFASKVEVLKFPIVGRILKILDGVFLERDNLKQEIKAMQVIKHSMKKGDVNWALFPEGTRNKDYHAPLGEFKAGSFKVPATLATPILPVAIWGTQVILSTKIHWRRYPVFLQYLPPIHASDFAGNTVKIATYCQSSLQEVIDDMRKKHPKRVEYFAKNKDFVQYLTQDSTSS